MAWWRRIRREDLQGLRDERTAFERGEQRLRQDYLGGYAQGVERLGSGFGSRFPRLSRGVLLPTTILARRIVVDDVSTHAGALTYAALLSIPALLLFSVSIAGFVLAGNPSAQQAVVDGLTKFLPSDFASATGFLTNQLNAAIEGRLSFGLLGLITLLWTASGLASRLRHALGQIFGTGWAGVLTGRFVGMIIGLLMILAIFGLAAFSIVEGWFASGSYDVVAQIGAFLVLALGEFVFFLALYRILTPSGPSWRWHVPGAAAFVICFEGLLTLGSFYFSRVVANSTALYGTLGSLFGAIAFLYATAWLLLAGAELSAFIWRRRRGDASGASSGPRPD